jgi:hypothetical protein
MSRAEVRIRRHDGILECDVIFVIHGQEMVLPLPDYAAQ